MQTINCKSKHLIILGLFITFSFHDISGQYWDWAHGIGDTTANTVSNAMCIYNGTDVIVTGSFSSVSLKMGPFTLTGAGRDDIFIARFNAAGNYVWAAGFGGTSDEAGTAVAADDQGNFYLAGTFSSRSITFGSHTIQNKGDKDGFLVKINPGKEVEWAVGIGTLADDEITGIAVDSHSNIYVTGNMSNNGIFVARIDQNGNVLWERKGTGQGEFFAYVRSNAIAVDDENNCYITGGFYERLVFDGNNTITSSRDQQYGYYQNNAFLAKYDQHGNFIDAVAIADFYNGQNICFSFDKLYVGGSKIEYGMGWGWPLAHSEIYLCKYNTDLSQAWLRSAGGLTLYHSLDIPLGISSDENGNIYQTGSFFSEGIKFGPDSLENHFNKDYYYRQVFVFKYDSLGNPVWGKDAGGIHCEAGRAIQVVSEDNFYLSGTYESKQMEFSSHVIENNGSLYKAYVHLRPPREYRNTFVFLAMYYTGDLSSPPVPCINRLHPYPNPADDFIRIENYGSSLTGGQVSMFSIQGRLVKVVPVNPGDNTITIDIRSLPAGIYIVKTVIDDNVSTHRVIKK
jgi:hypothetical protein